ncbi:hypothetical protein [Streptomyces sp. NPDC054849]
MTGTRSDSASGRTAGEGAWALPLLAIAPAAVLRLFTDLSTPLLIIAWLCVALSGVLLAAGWKTVLRNSMHGGSAWFTCVIAHVAFVVQVIGLVRR